MSEEKITNKELNVIWEILLDTQKETTIYTPEHCLISKIRLQYLLSQIENILHKEA